MGPAPLVYCWSVRISLFVTCVAAPTVPVALKVTGLPVSPLADAESVLEPAVFPSVHAVAAATPLASVVTGVGSTAPPPDATANVTETPATGLLN